MIQTKTQAEATNNIEHNSHVNQYIEKPFQSCTDLQQLSQTLCPNLVALQLSKGPLQGRIRIVALKNFRFTLLETNQSLFLSGKRRPGTCTMAIPLQEVETNNTYRAQGIEMPWAGIIGFNRRLTDFDLKIPAGAQLATVVISHETWSNRYVKQGDSSCLLERWEKSNQLELQRPNFLNLQQQLLNLVNGKADAWTTKESDQLIDRLIQCFEDPTARTLPIAKREVRHEAAIELLHWCANNPTSLISIEKISNEIFQSRTSLFKGSKEHFQRTPMELQRAIRMDRVRQLLLNPRQCRSKGLKGVGEIAASLGFSSRSHFAKHYEDYYHELPIETLRQHHTQAN
jgi:AraC-like DNA-binding protein